MALSDIILPKFCGETSILCGWDSFSEEDRSLPERDQHSIITLWLSKLVKYIINHSW